MARVIRLQENIFMRLAAAALAIWLLASLIEWLRPEARVVLMAPEAVDLYTIGDSTLAEAATPAGRVQLKRALFCLDMHENKPVLVKSSFKRNVDYLYCYTILSTTADSVPIRHRWIIDGQAVFERRLTVKGENCRLWSRRHILAKQSGDGRVEIVLENGNILGSAVFKLL